MKLAGKVAVITGAGSGFGRASAELFAREGARVVVADLNADAGAGVAAAIEGAGGQARFVRTDVSQADDVARMIEAAVDSYGRLDILFNNAGVPMAFTPVEETPDELYERIMNVNVRGVYLGCKLAVPIMKRQGSGVILNTASTAGVRPRPGLHVYAASKGAVIAFTKALALELAPAIRVNCINPVAGDTPMLAQFIGPKRDYQEGKAAFINTIPMGRLSTPEDIARGALFLASDDAALITGIGLEIDGGRCI